ncbi:EF hand [Rosistilla carotiformis]|uniref:EF hand n=1 Tax=Rosistilla carotiformis TaxID=2528017 RepID=A0A518JPG5_9BACT|nr:EF-hand domain-containing protein [Rosistilla carotiformis]QDV67435.1 EF hand [Rosistilla carotiformis]
MFSRQARIGSLVCLLAIIASDGWSQPPFGRGDRGDRGGDRGDRGGDRGDRGGDRGGRGGRGGFDPSSFIDRLDRNGNGMIDTDEMEGPAKFMLDRMARDNPKIDTSKPISLDSLKQGFEKMRGQRDSGRDSDRDRDRGRDRDAERREVEEAMELDLLVMGFDVEKPAEPVPGFGSAGELFAVRVTPADERTATERMGRYDRNKNGYLDKEEMSGNWFGNPLDFDRNGDGRLSPAELAVRYARRRVTEEEVKEERSRREARREPEKKPTSEEDPFGGRKSYRRMVAESDAGLPGWFNERDRDQDGQVMMAEYASVWNDDLIHDFFKFDLNSDGVITAAECYSAVESGASPGSSVSSSSSASVRSESAMTSTTSKPAASATPSAAGSDATLDPKYVGYAKRIIERSDKNKDGVLTAAEWKDMLLDISPADANKDARITVEEYATWLKAKSTR